MARNERKRNMDQPARSALSGLAEALASVNFAAPTQKEPGEFTAEEAANETGLARYSALTNLKRLIKEGKASRRAAIVNGRAGFFYRLL